MTCRLVQAVAEAALTCDEFPPMYDNWAQAAPGRLIPGFGCIIIGMEFIVMGLLALRHFYLFIHVSTVCMVLQSAKIGSM